MDRMETMHEFEERFWREAYASYQQNGGIMPNDTPFTAFAVQNNPGRRVTGEELGKLLVAIEEKELKARNLCHECWKNGYRNTKCQHRQNTNTSNWGSRGTRFDESCRRCHRITEIDNFTELCARCGGGRRIK